MAEREKQCICIQLNQTGLIIQSFQTFKLLLLLPVRNHDKHINPLWLKFQILHAKFIYKGRFFCCWVVTIITLMWRFGSFAKDESWKRHILLPYADIRNIHTRVHGIFQDLFGDLHKYWLQWNAKKIQDKIGSLRLGWIVDCHESKYYHPLPLNKAMSISEAL